MMHLDAKSPSLVWLRGVYPLISLLPEFLSLFTPAGLPGSPHTPRYYLCQHQNASLCFVPYLSRWSEAFLCPWEG